jgi:hypothetical protein
VLLAILLQPQVEVGRYSGRDVVRDANRFAVITASEYVVDD